MTFEQRFISNLRLAYGAHANPEKAVTMSAYLKNHFKFFGIKKPERMVLSNPFFEESKSFELNRLKDITLICWNQPEREFQYFAMEMLYKNLRKWDKSTIQLFEKISLKKSWWDSIDFIATKLVGNYFTKWHEEKPAIINRWINENSLWLNRIAIIFQLKYKEQTDTNILEQAILKHRYSDVFFHQKAIGWALRQYGKTNEIFVRDFLKQNKLKPLSYREATKHFRDL